MNGHEKLVQKMTSFHVYHFVSGHLSLLIDVGEEVSLVQLY